MRKEKRISSKEWAIYLDTNVLLPFSISLDHPLFQILMDISEKWNMSFYIPEVVYLEWMNKKKKEIEITLKRIKSNVENLKTRYLFNEIDLSKFSAQKLFEQSKSILDENIEKNKIEIIKTHKVDLDRLISMSINKIRPFEEKREKGFRDSLIFFTILNDAKNGNKICGLISDDKVFSHEDVIRVATEEGVDYVHYTSIEAFKESIEELKIKIVQKVKEAELKELEEFLKSKQEQINNFIREKGKFSLYYLNTLMKPSIPADIFKRIHKPPPIFHYPNVKQINKIEVLEIKAPSLPVEIDKEIIPIYFMAKLKFHVIVERTASRPSDTKIGIEGVEYPSFDVPEERHISEEEIEGEFPVYASIKVEDKKYSEIKIEQVGAWWLSS